MTHRILIAALALGWTSPLFALPAPAAKTGLASPSNKPVSPAPAPAAAAQPASPAAEPATKLPAKQLALLAAEVRLDRADFSPGTLDGRDGSNFRQAAAAWRAANKADGDTGKALAAADPRPVLTRYTIAPEDVAGPFAPVPKDLAKMAEMKVIGYASPREALAERFHASEALLARLNPGATFAAGEEITVPNIERKPLAAKVARIEIDKAHQQLRAFGGDGALLALYPATVGSTERPAPTGTWAVRAVAPHATYTYDPKRLTFGKAAQGKLTIPAGPNNPVGGVWIDLTKDTYGIHGTPDPELVGKRASHGCVRLTNWDATELGRAVEKGTMVEFVGTERRKA